MDGAFLSPEKPMELEQKRSGRILALDYGRRRIGIAVSDELGMIARPLTTIERTNRRKDMGRLREMAREQGAVRIVVGHPLEMDGGAGEMAREAERFAERVRKELGLEVEMVDERLTSWAAEETMAETGQRRRGAKDDVAAAVLLRDYLTSQESARTSREKTSGSKS
jgi:putative holliday junction resolvase